MSPGLIGGERLHWNKRGEEQSHTTQRGGKASCTVTGTLPRVVEPRLLAERRRGSAKLCAHARTLGPGTEASRYQLYILVGISVDMEVR